MTSEDRQICPHCDFAVPRLLAAERLAAAVTLLIHRGRLDPRSAVGDALLDYYQGSGAAPDVPSADEAERILRGE